MGYLPTQYDFPNATMYDSDLRETLRLAKELYNEYNAMYTGFKKLNEDFAKVEADFSTIQTRFDGFARRMDGLSDEIASAVNTSVSAEMVLVNNQIAANLRDMRLTIDERLKAAEKQLSTFMSDIKRLYDTDALKLESLVHAAIGSLDGRFLELAKELTEKFELDYESNKSTLLYLIEEVREEYKREDQDIRGRLDEIIKEYPEVWNIARGYRTDVESAILDSYDALRYYGNTAKSHDYKQATAATQDGYDLPAIVWDTAGRDVFYPIDKCINPITGIMQPVCEVIDAVAEFTHRGRITAEQYAELELTADEYAAYSMTAHDYKFWSYYILTGAPTVPEHLQELDNITMALSGRLGVIESRLETIDSTLADYGARIAALESEV